MTLDQLRYALSLAVRKNFSRAASDCHITQPSLSVQISKLEEELGVVLFDRTRSGVDVTAYGAELLKQARLIINETARLTELAADLKSEVRGRFRLGIIPTLAPSVLPFFLGEFGRRFPKVELAICEESTEHLVHGIDAGAIDGAILSTPPVCPESILEKVLFYEPFLIFASPGHPILKTKKVHSKQISAEEILLLDETHCLRDQVLQLCKYSQKNRAPGQASEKRFRIESGSLQTLIEVIRRDSGYTLLPALSAQFLTPEERLASVREFDKPSPARKVSLVFHRAHLKRSMLEGLKESILATLPDAVSVPRSGDKVRILPPGAEHFEL